MNKRIVFIGSIVFGVVVLLVIGGMIGKSLNSERNDNITVETLKNEKNQKFTPKKITFDDINIEGMEVTKLSSSVYKVGFLPGTIVETAPTVNVWLVVNGEDVHIIDTGFAEMTEGVMQVAEKLGTPASVLITHGHLDHVLGVHQLVERFEGIKIYVDSKEIEEINKGIPPYPVKDENMEGMFEELTDEVVLAAGLEHYITPGHSPGHAIFYHRKDKVLMVGDLFITTDTRLLPPIKRFTPDMNESIDSGSIVDEIKPRIITSSHGDDLLYTKNLYTQLAYFFRDAD